MPRAHEPGGSSAEGGGTRLLRAFNGLNLPDALRDRADEAEDLDFLLERRRGKPALPAATKAQLRLTALTQGGVHVTDIKKLRSAAAINCTMCHGR